MNFPARKNWLGKTTEHVHAINGIDLQIRRGETDILMELTKWVEASDNDILSDIYQQTINYVVSGQHPTL
ncbi:biofilm-dependent modulation protein [Escherichia coli]|nr:biofilm-dependent modulation protein [Escherichia coli]